MKKILTIALAAILTLAFFAACTSPTPMGNQENTPEINTQTPEFSQKVESTFDYAKEITVVSREDGSGTRGAFTELFKVAEKNTEGKTIDNTTIDAVITNSTSVMMQTVSGNEYAIGYISLGSLNDTVKALKIDGAVASAQEIENGAYKICRPFIITTKGEVKNETAKDFMAFIMSSDGQAVIEKGGYIPVKGLGAYSGAKPKGKAVVGGSSSVSPIMEKLIEAYKAVNPDAEIELQTSDSSSGMTQTIDGVLDIGMSSRELKDTETGAGLVPVVIATDGIAVIVNNNCLLNELTSEQIKGIFTGEILNWNELK